MLPTEDMRAIRNPDLGNGRFLMTIAAVEAMAVAFTVDLWNCSLADSASKDAVKSGCFVFAAFVCRPSPRRHVGAALEGMFE